MKPANAHGHASWSALGTTVVLRVRDERALADARLLAERELAAIDGACSRFRTDSELSRVNAAPGRPVAVGPLFLEALELALRAAALTDGDVDPTLGRLLELAGYDRDFALLPAAVSEPAAPRAVRLSVGRVAGWQAVRVDRAAGRVTVPPGVKLDLGSSAKALVADRIAAAVSRALGCGALAAVGGDVSLAGTAPEGGWEIRVTEDHRSGRSAPGQTIVVRSGGIATSSTAVRRWSHGGAAMHHLLDPRSGLPVQGPVRTASVAAASCVDANVAATCAVVRGANAAGWLDELGLPARLVLADGSAHAVAGWPEPVARERLAA
jgi:FAD:protein FMN transferase